MAATVRSCRHLFRIFTNPVVRTGVLKLSVPASYRFHHVLARNNVEKFAVAPIKQLVSEIYR